MNEKIINVYLPKNKSLPRKIRKNIQKNYPDVRINIVENIYPSICEVNFTMLPIDKFNFTMELMDACSKKTFFEWICDVFR